MIIMYNIASFIKQTIYFVAYLIHRNNDSKVVYYHDVSKKYTDMGTDFSLVKKHVQIIRESGYEIVPSISKQKKQVMICFDDGWAGIYDYKDFFVKQNIYPTIFIAVDLLGKDGYLTVEQIKELYGLGFYFECHTWSHQSLTLLPEEKLEHELMGSKEELEKLFEHSFSAICYPQGRFSKHINELCQKYGYKHQFASISGSYFEMEKQNIICRICAQFASSKEFKWMLNSNSRLFKIRQKKQHVKGSL